MDVENRADPGRTHAGLYVRAMAKWLAVAMVTGVFCGVVGSLFHIGVERATELREQHPWLLWCLPAAGLVIVAFYKLTKTEGQGTNDIIEAVHHGRPLSIWLLPVWWGLDGVWLAVVAAELLALAVTASLFAANRRRYGYL